MRKHNKAFIKNEHVYQCYLEGFWDLDAKTRSYMADSIIKWVYLFSMHYKFPILLTNTIICLTFII